MIIIKNIYSGMFYTMKWMLYIAIIKCLNSEFGGYKIYYNILS